MDFSVEYHGSIVLLRLYSEAAQAWVTKYLSQDVIRCQDGVVVERRYIEHIVEGMQLAGLIAA